MAVYGNNIRLHGTCDIGGLTFYVENLLPLLYIREARKPETPTQILVYEAQVVSGIRLFNRAVIIATLLSAGSPDVCFVKVNKQTWCVGPPVIVTTGIFADTTTLSVSCAFASR